jgi:hypothetical protein
MAAMAAMRLLALESPIAPGRIRSVGEQQNSYPWPRRKSTNRLLIARTVNRLMTLDIEYGKWVGQQVCKHHSSHRILLASDCFASEAE